MTTTTKVLLAAFALFVGVLIVYYGIISPSGQPSPASATVSGADAGQADLGPSQSNRTQDQETRTAGDRSGRSTFLSDSVTQALDGGQPSGAPTRTIDAGPLGSVAGDPLVEPAHTPSSGGDRLASSESHATPPTANPSTRVSIDRNNIAGSAIEPTVDPAARSAAARSTGTQGTGSNPSTQTKSEYVVKSGDTLSSIAQDWFGETRKWVLISRENPLADPNHLKIGQKLRLPAKDAALDSTPKPPPVDADSRQVARTTAMLAGSGGGIHTVRSGETLSSIARAVYGDDAKWVRIFDANKSVLNDDPDALKIGMKLVIPKKDPSGA